MEIKAAVANEKSGVDVALKLGATRAINAKAGSPVDHVKSLTCGRGVDYSLETTAIPRALRQAVECLHARADSTGRCNSLMESFSCMSSLLKCDHGYSPMSAV
ncbi:zinc-binding dehydrogenase [Burkholderia sp. Ac-20345]|uniref:zinc-binding dehydrogenase n=1 Tax=Burkholderia sp. Ac-20345 TaxID=2703891 RepID=UPI00197BE883|nr:zinc-binding dehydrogenase [Burkholderia sp. Ac-20345]MBN3780356.1 zinc-binding dehydrogenase [Burkholderia sp. Ac-20345]